MVFKTFKREINRHPDSGYPNQSVSYFLLEIFGNLANMDMARAEAGGSPFKSSQRDLNLSSGYPDGTSLTHGK